MSHQELQSSGPCAKSSGANASVTSEESHTSVGRDNRLLTKRRVKHWSAIEGPLTLGFRKQREREATKLQERVHLEPIHSSQTEVLDEEEARHSFTSMARDNVKENPDQTGSVHHDQDLLQPLSPAEMQSYHSFLNTPSDDFQDREQGSFDLPSSYGLHFNQPMSTRVSAYPHLYTDAVGDRVYASATTGDMTQPVSPHHGVLRPVSWAPVQIYEPVTNTIDSSYATDLPGPPHDYTAHQDDDLDYEDHHEDYPTYFTPRARSGSQRKRPTDSSSRSLKRKRSSRDDLAKDTSFHEHYVEIAKKGGKLPTDINCFGYDGLSGDDVTNWSTLDHFKRQKKGHSSNIADGTSTHGSTDLPKAYQTFHPQFKPKAGTYGVVTTSNTFKLPIGNFGRTAASSSSRQSNSSDQLKASHRKRTLFRPAPPGAVIDILDDDEIAEKKVELAKKLDIGVLGLKQRPKVMDPAEEDKVTDGQAHKSSLYRQSKLGDEPEDVPREVSRPFFSNSFHDWPAKGNESQMDGSAIHPDPEQAGNNGEGTSGSAEASTQAGQPATLTDPAPSSPPSPERPFVAVSNPLQPLAKKWTFKLWGN